MIRLARLFANPFLDEEVSFMELLNCATDTQQRLIANNPGSVYNGIINGLTVALATVDQCATDDIVKLGLRKGAKAAKGIFRDSLSRHIGKLHAKVTGHFGPGDPAITTIFAGGREIFGDCQDDDLRHHLEGVLANLTPHVPAMGATGTQALSDISGLISTWLALFAASESSTGAKTTTEKEKRAAKDNLAAKLHVALLTLALQQATEASALKKAVTSEQAETLAALYFRQDLLEDPGSPEDEEPAPPAPPTP